MPVLAGHDYANYFPRRANAYVGNLVYAADVTQDGVARIEFGVIPASTPNSIMNAVDITNVLTKGGTVAGTFRASMAGRYGRNLILTLGAAGTPTVTVYGRDYLGQPVSENIVATGAAAAAGKKAFSSVEGVTTSAGVATTLSLGFGVSMGVPFACSALIQELTDDVVPGAGALTLSTPVQTATSADPRGLYTPATAPNGARNYVIIARVLQGNLHGARHYAL